jgi:DNA-damage-inducible protein J
MEPNLKQEAENILYELGISPTQAITMLYKHVAREQDWPTNLKIPNQKTIDTFNDTDNLNGLTKSSSLADMWNKLGI